jgi:hypothetical protein
MVDRGSARRRGARRAEHGGFFTQELIAEAIASALSLDLVASAGLVSRAGLLGIMLCVRRPDRAFGPGSTSRCLGDCRAGRRFLVGLFAVRTRRLLHHGG